VQKEFRKMQYYTEQCRKIQDSAECWRKVQYDAGQCMMMQDSAVRYRTMQDLQGDAEN
jgi:hypothetical protein